MSNQVPKWEHAVVHMAEVWGPGWATHDFDEAGLLIPRATGYEFYEAMQVRWEQAGAQGWELVAVSNEGQAFFKRPIPELQFGA